MGYRRSRFGYRSLVAVLGVALVAAGPVAASPAAGAAPGAVRGVVRLDQVGYAIGEAKRAYLMAEAPAKLALVENATNSLGDSHRGMLGIAAGGKGVGGILGNHVDFGHR